MSAPGEQVPEVRIDLSVRISGSWVTPEVIADTATALADAMASRLNEAGHPVDPGGISMRLDADVRADQL